MEVTTALQSTVAEAPLGSCLFGCVRDYAGRAQGTALFVVCGLPRSEAGLVKVPAQFGGSSDAYYRWWGQTESGPPGPGAPMEIVVSQEEYTDPDVNRVVLIGALVLDTSKLCRSKAGERLAGWDALAMRCAKLRLAAILRALPADVETPNPPQAAGIQDLQHALGAGAAEGAPDEMLSREDLVRQLESARLDIKRARDQEEGKRHNERTSGSRIGQVIVARVVSNEAGASLAVKSKRPASHTLLKALARKGVDSEASDEDDPEGGRPQKVARSSPGKLAHAYLTEMYNQSHVSLGLGNLGEPDFPRVASFYLTTVLTRRLPNFTQNMRNWREAQTLAGILDCLSAGEVCQAMDIVAQRLKALELATTQGHWQQARWLELLSIDTTGALQPGEVRAAQRREKLDRALGQPMQASSSIGSASTALHAQAQVQAQAQAQASSPVAAANGAGAAAGRENEKSKGKKGKGKGRK
eukprot:6491237-Amphidinium_carterae.2